VGRIRLGVFTAYVTASLIIAGANLVDSPGSPWPGLTAVAGFVLGAVVAGWDRRGVGDPPRCGAGASLAGACSLTT
jgi:hypothetical protein